MKVMFIAIVLSFFENWPSIEAAEVAETNNTTSPNVEMSFRTSNLMSNTTWMVDKNCTEFTFTGSEDEYKRFTPIPLEVRSGLRSIFISYASFDVDVLLDSLDGCSNLEILNLTEVRFKGDFSRKAHLPKLKTFIFIVTYDGYEVYSPTTTEITNCIFFYKHFFDWQLELNSGFWDNVTIYVSTGYFDGGKVKLAANELLLQNLNDSILLSTVLRARQIKNLTLHSCKANITAEDLKYFKSIKTLKIVETSLLGASLSDMLQRLVNVEDINIDANYNPESVDLAGIQMVHLRSLRLEGVSLRWSSTGLPTRFDNLKSFSLKTCDFNSFLVRFGRTLETINLRWVNFLSGTVSDLFRFNNLSRISTLSIQDIDGVRCTLDISLIPFTKHLKLQNCDVFSSVSLQLSMIEKIELFKVEMHENIMQNFSLYFKPAKTIRFWFKISALFLEEVLKTEVQDLGFYFDWDSKELQVEPYKRILKFLMDLGLNESNPNMIFVRRTSNETSLNTLYEEVPEVNEEPEIVSIYRIIVSSICALGLIGNSISAFVLSRSEMRKQSSSYILLGLAFWDSLFLLTSWIQTFAVLQNLNWEISYDLRTVSYDWYAQFLLYPLNKTAYSGSVYLTLLITIDRCIAVSMPLRANRILTIKRTVKNILAISLFSLFLNFPRWIESINWGYPLEGRYGNYYHQRSSLITMNEYRIYYQLYCWSILMYVVPFVLIIFFNAVICVQVRRANLARRDLAGQSHSSDNSITRMLLTVVIVFLICNATSASIVWNFILGLPEDSELMLLSDLVALLPLLINSAANFLIYCVVGTRFRADCVKLCFLTFNFFRVRIIPGGNDTSIGSTRNINSPRNLDTTTSCL